MKEILKALDDKLNNSDLDGIIAEIDTDGSGTVDFDGNFFSVLNASGDTALTFTFTFRIHGDDDWRLNILTHLAEKSFKYKEECTELNSNYFQSIDDQTISFLIFSSSIN